MVLGWSKRWVGQLVLALMVMVAGRVFAVTVVEECHSVLVLATVGVHWAWNKTHPSTHRRQLAVLNTHTQHCHDFFLAIPM